MFDCRTNRTIGFDWFLVRFRSIDYAGMLRGRVPAACLVLFCRTELSAGFAMLAGPLAHVIPVLLRHITYRKTLYLWDIS